MMWKEIFWDLKNRLKDYNEKISNQPKRSTSRMVNAIFWFFFCFATAMAASNIDGLGTFCYVLSALFIIRYIHIYIIMSNKDKKLMIRFILMAIIELILLFTTYYLALMIFIVCVIVILIAFPFIFSINIKKF